MQQSNFNHSFKSSVSRDFSLVLGGALYHCLRRCHLAGDAMHLLYRRLFVITALTWLPLLFLVYFQPGSNRFIRLSFLTDVEVHARLLVALPVMIGAELIVHLRLGPVVDSFLKRQIILPQDYLKFDRAIESTINLRNSVWVELGILIAVYSVGLYVWGTRPISPANWDDSGGGRWDLTLAGYWYVFVSVPIFQFTLIRWYFRLFLWFRFLLRVSRIDLALKPAHPDRAGGMGFLSKSAYAFGPILFAQGALCAGLIGSRVLHGGEALMTFKQQFFGFLVFFLFTILVPLVMFSPALLKAKREGLSQYGLLAQRYVENFEQKWIHNTGQSEEILGTADIQSLADLSNGYQIVSDMRLVPFGLKDIFRLSASFAAPFIPLLLTVFSLEELISRIIRLLF